MKRRTDTLVKTVRKTIIPETIAMCMTSRTYVEAAERLGISVSALYQRFDAYPEIREQIAKVTADMPEQALATLKRGSVRAAETLIEGLGTTDEALKYKVAGDVLDRVGVTNKQGPEVAVQNNILVMPSELIGKYGISSKPEDSSE